MSENNSFNFYIPYCLSSSTMPNMCIDFLVCVSMFVTFFLNATVHTTLPLTLSFLISLAVLSLSRCLSVVRRECEGTADSSHPYSVATTNQSELTANTQQTHNQQSTNNEQAKTSGDETVCGPCGVCCVACVHKYMIFTCCLHVLVLVPLTFHNVSCFLLLAAVSSTVSHVEQRPHVENCLKLLREAGNDSHLTGKANNWRNREHAVLNLFSNLNCVRSKGFFGGPLGPSKDSTWSSLGTSRTGGDPSSLTPPCGHSEGLRVCWQHAHMLLNLCACCRPTRRSFQCTHGCLLYLHTGFSAGHTTRHHTTPHHLPHTTNTRSHATQHQKQHHTEKERKRIETERERR